LVLIIKGILLHQYFLSLHPYFAKIHNNEIKRDI
jgi:hypothetical protein